MDNSADSSKNTLIKHLRALSGNSSVAPYISKLKELNLNDEQIDLFIIMLQPAIAEHLQGLVLSELTTQEIVAIDIVSKERNFDESQAGEMFVLAYEDKTGKKLEDEIESFIEDTVNNISNLVDKVKETLEKVKDLDEEKAKAEFDKLIINN